MQLAVNFARPLPPILAPPHFALLPHPPPPQVAAASTACTLVLDFCNIAPALVEAGLPQALASLLNSMVLELRLKSL